MRNTISRSVVAALAALFITGACSIEGTPGFTRDPPVLPDPVPPYAPPAPVPQTRKFIILHTNDEHSQLLGFGPNSDYPYLPNDSGVVDAAAIGAMAVKIGSGLRTDGGFVRLDYLINKIRSAAIDPVVTVSAGDTTMGTFFHVAGSQGAPDFLAQALAGYDFMTIGNHEFDLGADFYSATITAVNNLSFSGAVPIIASNIHFEDAPGHSLATMFGPGDTGAFIMPWATKVLANGLKIGFLGALGYQAALVAPFKAPIEFSTPMTGSVCTKATVATTCVGAETDFSCTRGHCVNPLDVGGHIGATVADLQVHIDTLRNQEGVDVVILLSHQGSTEDAAVATLTTGIDVIIGGHSHEWIPAALIPGTNTIMAQAGKYMRALGQLTITVEPDGTVGFDPDAAATALHDVDWTLDAEIFAGTTFPATMSTAFQRALTLTGGLVGPFLGQLNGMLVPALNQILPATAQISSIVSSQDTDTDPLVSSDHDILAPKGAADSNLSHLVTDAEWATVVSQGCLLDLDGAGPMEQLPGVNYSFVVAIQANGVLRETLQFGANDSSTTASDIFRTLPLGASPFQTSSPGYPLLMFQFGLIDLFAALDLGVTTGLDDNSDFFLSYSGMKIQYDAGAAGFSSATFNQMSTSPQGRVARISIGNDTTGWTEIFHQDPADTASTWLQRWSVFDPTTDKALVIINLYMAGFIDAFGFTPLEPYGGGAITPSANPLVPSALASLATNILCKVALVADCTTQDGNPHAPAIVPCVAATGGDVPNDPTTGAPTWPAPLAEIKEWAVLLGYLTGPVPALNGVIADCLYEDDVANCGPFLSRVAPYQ